MSSSHLAAVLSRDPLRCSKMFATAARNFVEEVDHGGLLIPVSTLNDTIDLLTVVVKRKSFWIWQKPRYIPTDFHLNDILTGDTPINPGKSLSIGICGFALLFLNVLTQTNDNFLQLS